MPATRTPAAKIEIQERSPALAGMIYSWPVEAVPARRPRQNCRGQGAAQNAFSSLAVSAINRVCA
jgi:hypothetical protein